MRGVFVSIVLAAAVAVTPAFGVVKRPAVRVVSQKPMFVVSGTGFRPGERVWVSVTSKTASTKTAFATRYGTFRVALKRPISSPCGAFFVRAAGSRGSDARVHVWPPECSPRVE